MKTISLVLLNLAVGLSAGCDTLPEKSVTAGFAPPPTPAATTVSGTDLDQSNTEKVRVGETLKSYPVGRYVDPQDSNVMHEAHVVYRKEAGSSWNLNPNAPTVIPLGPVLAVADPAKTPSPLPAELERKMAEQNQLVASLIEQNEALSAKLAKFAKDMADMRAKRSTAGVEGGK